MRRNTTILVWGLGLPGLLVALLLWRTWAALQGFPETLPPDGVSLGKVQVLDRHGTPLSTTLQNTWNVHDVAPLHTMPPLLQQAFIVAEDKRFLTHRGVDWRARLQALVQNVKAGRVVRGASTITEQVVRLLHPRPRTVWSRWLEGIEAQRLEARFTKAAIVEFYLNQVPYARQRRGVVQAAHLYFNRDLLTLSPHEMLALAVLVRAPSRLDLTRGSQAIRPPLARLARRLYEANILSGETYQQVLQARLTLRAPHLPVRTPHFLRYVRSLAVPNATLPQGKLRTTLDASLQRRAQALLDRRQQDLQAHGVTDGALLIVDHHTNEVLAWASVGGSQIDAVQTPRQPGSTLKPFLYALALERGWTAATLIDDAPLTQPLGAGLHRYRNYSGQYYGPLRLREALGNSLNIPAIRTIAFVGVAPFLTRLHHLGFRSLTRFATHYGHGLALGNGEVSLFELVQAYAVLARQGLWQPLRVVPAGLVPAEPTRRVYSAEVSTLMAHILADPTARQLEFGAGSLLHFPVQTAVKTGTSSDYRDAWAVGFSQRYTAGVWLGNLQQRPMRGISGARGPALVLRALFAELHRHVAPRPLLRSPHLIAATICRTTGHLATPDCPTMQEWFMPPYLPHSASPPERLDASVPLRVLQPTPGLHLAMDPRIPDTREAFPFVLTPAGQVSAVDWLVDGRIVGSTHERQFLWPLVRGTHTVQAHVWYDDHPQPVPTAAVTFLVK